MRAWFALAAVGVAACSGGRDARLDTVTGDSPAEAPAVSTAVELRDTSGAAVDAGRAGSAATATPGQPSAGQPAAGAPPATPAVRGDAGGGGSAHPEDNAPVVASTLPQVDTTITMMAHGPDLSFDPARITLRQGTRVRIRFQNHGVFAHNFILVRDEDDLDEIIERAHDARENVPMSLRSKMIAWTKLANPSQTVEAAFVVPAPGEYVFVCLVEGHANVMVGTLRSLP